MYLFLKIKMSVYNPYISWKIFQEPKYATDIYTFSNNLPRSREIVSVPNSSYQPVNQDQPRRSCVNIDNGNSKYKLLRK